MHLELSQLHNLYKVLCHRCILLDIELQCLLLVLEVTGLMTLVTLFEVDADAYQDNEA